MNVLRKLFSFLILLLFFPIFVGSIAVYMLGHWVSFIFLNFNRVYVRFWRNFKRPLKQQLPVTYKEMDKYLVMATHAITELAKKQDNHKIYDFSAFRILGVLITKPKEEK